MQKLIAGFVAVAMLAGSMGVIGLYANNRVVSSYEMGEKHFGTIVEASNEVSSFAKRAEGHLMLYLTLHDESDRQKFFVRLEGLRNQTSIMDERITNPDARKILENITRKTSELQSVGESLIGAYDAEIKAGGQFDPAIHKGLIRKLDNVAAGIRTDGLKLAKTEIELQARQQEAAKNEARRLYNTMLGFSIFVIAGAAALGYVISKNIAGPVIDLKDAVIEISRGNFGARTAIKSNDEIGELSRAFDKMAEELHNSRSEIEKRESELKKSRAELQGKLGEIERFNRLAVGRELKMIELKKKLGSKSGGKKEE